MRIIGGRLRGKVINPPAGYKARPTTDFAKEGLFDVLNNEYEFDGLAVLDLFGGTGAISYEFASRGASIVQCVEMSPVNFSFIRAQAAKLGLDNVNVLRHNVFEYINICKRQFDIVFADPPYDLEGVESLPDRLFDAGLLYDGGYFILEHSDRHSFADHPRFVKEKRYGRVRFSFFI